MGEYTPLGMEIGGLLALSWSVKKYRDVRDGFVSVLWESDDHKKRDAKAIEDHPKIKEMEGRIKELSRATNHPDESSFEWGDK